VEITLPNSQGNQSFRSVAGKRSNGRAVYLGDPRLALLGRSPVGVEKSALTTPCPVAAGSVFSGKVQQDVTHPDIVLAECDRQPQRLEQRRKGRPGQSGGILFEFVGHPEFKRPTLLPFVFIEGARRDLDDRHLVDLALESLDQILSIRFSRWTTA